MFSDIPGDDAGKRTKACQRRSKTGPLGGARVGHLDVFNFLTKSLVVIIDMVVVPGIVSSINSAPSRLCVPTRPAQPSAH